MAVQFGAPPRLRLSGVDVSACVAVNDMFTGVMCGSYHDVWMELTQTSS